MCLLLRNVVIFSYSRYMTHIENAWYNKINHKTEQLPSCAPPRATWKFNLPFYIINRITIIWFWYETLTEMQRKAPMGSQCIKQCVEVEYQTELALYFLYYEMISLWSLRISIKLLSTWPITLKKHGTSPDRTDLMSSACWLGECVLSLKHRQEGELIGGPEVKLVFRSRRFTENTAVGSKCPIVSVPCAVIVRYYLYLLRSLTSVRFGTCPE